MTSIASLAEIRISTRQNGATARLGEAAYAEIKRRIISNEFTPNFQQTESQLAESLGMSRTPIHEALVRLEKEGLIENISRHGMRVLPVAAKDMLEIYQVLTALELSAIELILSQSQASSLVAELRIEVEAMDRALEQTRSGEAWSDADARFHRKFFELCGNKRLMQVGLSFREQVDRARTLTLPLRDKTARSNAAHRELVNWMENGNTPQALLCHKTHRVAVTQELTEILARFQHLGL